MKTKVNTFLDKCYSYKRNAEVGPKFTINLLATQLCLTLSELVDVKIEILMKISSGPTRDQVMKITEEQINKTVIKSKELFEKFVSSDILDKKELQELIEAFDSDVKGITG